MKHKKPHKHASHKSKHKPQKRPALRETHTIYGLHAAKAAFDNPQRHIKQIYLTKDHPLLEDDQYRHYIEKTPSQIVTKQEIDDLIGTDHTVHQNILLHVEPLSEKSLDEIIQEKREKSHSHFILLDHVNDPHNIGAILRSACVFGADGVIVQDKHAPNMNATICKIACGAAEKTAYIRETNLSRSLETLKKAGYWCLGLDEWGEKTLRQAVQGTNKIVLVMGAEGPGLRPLIKKSCDELTKLQTATTFSSLNVSNASAIALYEVFESFSS